MSDKSNYNKIHCFFYLFFLLSEKVQIRHALINVSINRVLCAIVGKFQSATNPIQNTARKEWIINFVEKGIQFLFLFLAVRANVLKW
jgi:nucleoside permease NupC